MVSASWSGRIKIMQTKAAGGYWNTLTSGGPEGVTPVKPMAMVPLPLSVNWSTTIVPTA
jgi:hypothetical protein